MMDTNRLIPPHQLSPAPIVAIDCRIDVAAIDELLRERLRAATVVDRCRLGDSAGKVE
jgi:hypothetical protein